LSSEGAIVGVFSLITGADCTSEMVLNTYTQVPPFKQLAMQAFEAAGAEPWLEGQPVPGSEPDGGAGGAGGDGGAAGAGGEDASGGNPEMGGSPATGGSPSTGGSPATGGSGAGTQARRRSTQDSGCHFVAPGPSGTAPAGFLLLAVAAGFTWRRRA